MKFDAEEARKRDEAERKRLKEEEDKKIVEKEKDIANSRIYVR